MEGHWKFLGEGGGVLKAKILEEMYENKLEFPGGREVGVQNKKPSMGGVWIFSGTANSGSYLEGSVYRGGDYSSKYGK